MSKTNVVYPVTSCLYPSIQPTNYFDWGDDCSLFRYSIAAHFFCYLLPLLLLQASFSLEVLVVLLLELPTAFVLAVVLHQSLFAHVCSSIVLSLLECRASLLHLLYVLHFHTRLCPSWLLQPIFAQSDRTNWSM